MVKRIVLNLTIKAIIPITLIVLSSSLSDNKIGSMRKIMATRRWSDKYYVYKDFITPRSL